jgi:hypothetical protein
MNQFVFSTQQLPQIDQRAQPHQINTLAVLSQSHQNIIDLSKFNTINANSLVLSNSIYLQGTLCNDVVENIFLINTSISKRQQIEFRCKNLKNLYVERLFKQQFLNNCREKPKFAVAEIDLNCILDLMVNLSED